MPSCGTRFAARPTNAHTMEIIGHDTFCHVSLSGREDPNCGTWETRFDIVYRIDLVSLVHGSELLGRH